MPACSHSSRLMSDSILNAEVTILTPGSVPGITAGSGAPTGTSTNGALYIDETSGNLWQYTTSWAQIGNLKGATGSNGTRGTIYQGHFSASGSLPSSGIENGDFATVGSNSEVWQVVTGVWVDQSVSLEGATGPANSLAIGTVTTLSAGSNATASITGTAPSQTLNLGIPQGAAGSGGSESSAFAGAGWTDDFIDPDWAGSNSTRWSAWYTGNAGYGPVSGQNTIHTPDHPGQVVLVNGTTSGSQVGFVTNWDNGCEIGQASKVVVRFVIQAVTIQTLPGNPGQFYFGITDNDFTSIQNGCVVMFDPGDAATNWCTWTMGPNTDAGATKNVALNISNGTWYEWIISYTPGVNCKFYGRVWTPGQTGTPPLLFTHTTTMPSVTAEQYITMFGETFAGSSPSDCQFNVDLVQLAIYGPTADRIYGDSVLGSF